MGNFWNKIKYKIIEPVVINKIEITYDLITENGYKVCEVEDVIPNNPDHIYNDTWEVREKIDGFEKKNVSKFNKIANDYLNKFRGAKLIKISNGVVIPGKYIVKCTWDVYFRSRKATFEEYMRLKDE